MASINVSVDVYAAPPGTRGNAATGNNYIFVLDKEVVHVDSPGIRTEILYKLTDETLKRGISFTAAYINDPRSQLNGPCLSCSNENNPSNPLKLFDTIRFVHSNSHASLICISLQVKDSNNPDKLVAYDPEVTNEPGN